ncbi:MAG: 16S rRNA (guanine(966)-N(2))-methyltransferase RsmD [Steroidobacteraceae bacterium]
MTRTPAPPAAAARRGARAARGARTRELRIIAGRWRGRRWRFPAAEAIRPTPDRGRETLFNWLHGVVPGARCLDLYAGSGALGLEALSRGAASVVFVESDAAAARALRALLAEWGGEGGRVVHADALRFLAQPAGPFDLVFLDPPFGDDLLAGSCARLDAGGWLAPDARIYVEHARRAAPPAPPPPWRELRAGTAGEVGYHLYASGTEPGT